MGRITIFTAEGDLNSKQAVKELEKRSLPFNEIDVVAHPTALEHLESLVGVASSVPQVFFNTRYIGGVDNLKRELQHWDNSNRYASALAKYEAEIAPNMDPRNNHLALPDERNKIKVLPARARKLRVQVEMPDGTSLLARELLDKLRVWVPLTPTKYKGVYYKRSFTGCTLVSSLRKAFDISLHEAAIFSGKLSKGGFVKHVDHKHFPVGRRSSFHNTNTDVYQLRCDADPDVLNLYLAWPPVSSPDSAPNCLEIVSNLHKLLNVMELNSVDPVNGLLNAQHAISLKKFSKFEEAVCELQVLSKHDLLLLSEDEMTAFALNLYSVLIRYTYIKVGTPSSEADRLHMLSKIKFILAGDTYTLQEWVNILTFRTGLMGDHSSNSQNSEESSSSHLNMRRDKRLPFALFIGPHGGSRWSAPFSLFTPENLDKELCIAAHIFCLEDRNIQIIREENKARLLTSVFKTHRNELSSKECDLLKIILPYLSGKKLSDTSAMLNAGKPIRISYCEPELGLHTVSGPWYHKDASSPKRTKPLLGPAIGLRSGLIISRNHNHSSSLSSTFSRSATPSNRSTK